jgi:hypothetical protein
MVCAAPGVCHKDVLSALGDLVPKEFCIDFFLQTEVGTFSFFICALHRFAFRFDFASGTPG